MKISAYIIAFNEEEKIQDCINSVLWADEVILADSYSTDNTAKIASKMGAKVIQVNFKGFGDLRNKAVKACNGDWILSIDSDERCTEEVKDEILSIIDSPSADIYKIPRKNYFMGKFIRYSGWYPNYRQPQLFKRGMMIYDDLPVHEGYISNSTKNISNLENAIWQVPFKNFEEMLDKANRYSSLGVSKLENRDKKTGIMTSLAHGIWAFFKHYILKLGFLDGSAGFIIALGNFEGTFYRYLKLHEKRKKWNQIHKNPTLQ